MEPMSTNQALFTCLSCSISLASAEDQSASVIVFYTILLTPKHDLGVHYRSDYHRYNMKRRVAALPPVSAIVFNQKVLERKAENAVAATAKTSSCSVCKFVILLQLTIHEVTASYSKVYTSDGAYRSHINSRKHKENESRAPVHPAPTSLSGPTPAANSSPKVESQSTPALSSKKHSSSSPTRQTLTTVHHDTSDDELGPSIDAKIAAVRARLSTSHCLFCTNESPSIQENLTHMYSAHSFFIPDAEYLVDLSGLISYLGEKVAVGNVCLFCNEKSREYRSLQAVRQHMLDKSHCKVAYESPDDRLEISDFYDFTSSYPSAKPAAKHQDKEGEEEWEDLEDDDDGDDVDEVVDDNSSTASDVDGSLPDNQLTYGDSPFELVLPSGARIGHRSLRRYYVQSLSGPSRDAKEDPNSGTALVRRLLADKNSALVPRKGGFGAFGSGTDVVKARNRGEAREAGKHIRQFRDQKRREDFKTKVGFIANSQKHYRDPRKHYLHCPFKESWFELTWMSQCSRYLIVFCHLMTILARPIQ